MKISIYELNAKSSKWFPCNSLFIGILRTSNFGDKSSMMEICRLGYVYSRPLHNPNPKLNVSTIFFTFQSKINRPMRF